MKIILWWCAAGVVLAGIVVARQCARLPQVQDTGAPDAQVVDGSIANGRRAYVHCQACHGLEGQGVAGLFPPLKGSGMLAGDPVVLARMVIHGSSSSPRWPQPMPALGGRFTDGEIADLLTWLRAQHAPGAPPVTSDVVRAAR